MPVALGVIRAVEAPVYGEDLYKQMEAVQTKKTQSKLNDILMSGEVWQVKE
jgi:2-oxoglutarate ferredoxin oxidoreductase subunit beta